MATGAYLGIGGVKELKESYVGVGSVARNTTEIYVGVNGVPKLVWGKREFWYKKGVTTIGFTPQVVSSGTMSIVTTLDNLYIDRNSKTGYGHIRTTNKIDMTNISKVHVKCDLYIATSDLRLGLYYANYMANSPGAVTTISHSAVVAGNNTNVILSADTSKVKDMQYLYLTCPESTGTSGTLIRSSYYVIIKEIWYE